MKGYSPFQLRYNTEYSCECAESLLDEWPPAACRKHGAPEVARFILHPEDLGNGVLLLSPRKS